MNRLLLVFSLIILTLSATVASAQCIVRSRAAIVNTAVVATPAVAVVPTTIAAYGASYDGSVQEIAKLREQIAAFEARLGLLESARDAHNGRLSVLEARVGVLPPPAPKPAAEPKAAPAASPTAAASELPSLVSRSCIKCHQEAHAPKGGFVMVTAGGKLAALTCEQRLEAIRRINLADEDRDVMPPKGKSEPASDQEAAQFLDAMTKLKK